MTQEEKAKAYDEALEIANAAYKDEDRHLKATLERIFPELKESEDERIRKEILQSIRDNMVVIHKDECISWLENIPYTIDHEKREGFHLGYKAGLEKQGEKSSTVDIESMIEAYEQRLINQGNGVRNSPIVNMCVAAFKHGVENTLDELHLKQGETSPILSNSSNIGKDEQKPAWSEEDECYMGECIGAIATKDGWSFEEKRKTKHWLKSMKERCSWKPSDEQMKFLQKCIEAYNEVTFPTEVRVLSSLYNDLKKLK